MIDAKGPPAILFVLCSATSLVSLNTSWRTERSGVSNTNLRALVGGRGRL